MAAAAAGSPPFIVFAVDAADRLTLMAPTKTGPPHLQQIMLSYISAPKPSRRNPAGEVTRDEPCAFDATELIRSTFIGKSVQYTEDMTIEALQRTAGRLVLADGTNASELLLKNGFATVSERVPPKMPAALHAQYLALQAQAKTAKLGVWSPSAASKVRPIVPFPPANPAELAVALRGTTVKVLVDRVMTGSAFIVTNPATNQSLQLNLTGILAPSTRKKDGTGADPVGVEAQFHSQRLLGHRVVAVLFEGIDAFGNFLGSVVAPKGTFQEELLGKGLARINTATLANTEHREALAAAERAAQAKRTGVWTDYQERTAVVGGVATAAGGAAGAAAPTASCPTDFEGVLVQVISGDLIAVRMETGETVKLSLVGVRAPKSVRRDVEIDRATGQRAPETRVCYEDYTWESREFLRSKFAGHVVTVHVEYARVIDETKEVRPVANVADRDTAVNLNLAILKAGLAKCFLGRTDTASNAEQLVAAEAQAKEAQIGIHSATPSPITRVTEINRVGEKKARGYMTYLQRGSSSARPALKAVVEMVLSGSTFRVYVPREHFQFSIRLANIVTPSAGFNGAPGDAFAAESRDKAILLVQNREVEIHVDTVDKVGNFIGYMNYNGKSVALSMVESGLATASGRSLPSELVAAQERAQAAKLFIWSDKGGIPARQLKREESRRAGAAPTFAKARGDDAGTWRPVGVTDVPSSTSLYIVPNDAATEALKAQLTTQLMFVAANDACPHQPARDEIVAAVFKDDGSWNRAKVVSVSGVDGKAQVQYIDFGSSATVKFRDIRKIPTNEPQCADLKSTKGLASLVQLAYLRPLPASAGGEADAEDREDEGVAAIWALMEECGGEVFVKPEYTADEGRKRYVSVAGTEGTTDLSTTLSAELLKQGAALFDSAALGIDVEAQLVMLAQQEQARRNHRGGWRYGDIDDDEDEQ